VLNASSAAGATKAPLRVLLTPSGRRVPVEDEGTDVLELAEQGFYELRADRNEAEAVVAANVDPAESDLTPIDPREITAAAAGGGGTGTAGSTEGVPLTREAREKNQRLWWYFLVAGILLLGTDTLLSNRIAKA
jgi:hypothetical protein